MFVVGGVCESLGQRCVSRAPHAHLLHVGLCECLQILSLGHGWPSGEVE